MTTLHNPSGAEVGGRRAYIYVYLYICRILSTSYRCSDVSSSGPLMGATASQQNLAPVEWHLGREVPKGLYPEPFIRFYPLGLSLCRCLRVGIVQTSMRGMEELVWWGSAGHIWYGQGGSSIPTSRVSQGRPRQMRA